MIVPVVKNSSVAVKEVGGSGRYPVVTVSKYAYSESPITFVALSEKLYCVKGDKLGMYAFVWSGPYVNVKGGDAHSSV